MTNASFSIDSMTALSKAVLNLDAFSGVPKRIANTSALASSSEKYHHNRQAIIGKTKKYDLVRNAISRLRSFAHNDIWHTVCQSRKKNRLCSRRRRCSTPCEVGVYLVHPCLVVAPLHGLKDHPGTDKMVCTNLQSFVTPHQNPEMA